MQPIHKDRMLKRGTRMEGSGNGAAPRRRYLEIVELSKSFGSFQALRNVSLSIDEGEFICFLGPSGCGKTTLLRAIAGLDIQTTGTIRQAGCDISALPPAERDFGIVFQSYALFPNLSVEQNVGYGLKGRERSATAARVAELLALVGLPDQGRKYPAQLSGGQQQRVALARALAMSPGLLLLDEPLSALDARVRVHLRAEITQLQRRLGVTTIMVTHDQEEALTMADRIVVMKQGVIEQVGTPLEIYRRPASAFIADFIGTMNFLPATIAPDRRVHLGGIALDCAGGVDGLAPGSAALVCIRPEDVVVRGVTSATGNAVPVRIVGMEFLGSFFRTRLAPAGVDKVELAADFSINAVRDLALAPGQIVTVALPGDRLTVYPRN
jgi:iron(III) transport system ATP-binding protein